MRRSWLLFGIALLALVLAIGAVACDDDEGDGADQTPAEDATEPADVTEDEDMVEPGVVNVDLFEYTVAPDPASVPAGSVTFNAENIGGAEHELVIIRTDLDPAQLPTADDGSVDEGGEGIEVIDEIEEFEAGGSESLTVDLDAGSYALICNVVEDDGLSHYGEGMFTAFDVAE